MSAARCGTKLSPNTWGSVHMVPTPTSTVLPIIPGTARITTASRKAILSEGPDGDGGLSARQAGLHASCLPFLRERDVSILGNDGIQDVQPSGFGQDFVRPIHTVALVALGLWLIDNMHLTELVEA